MLIHSGNNRADIVIMRLTFIAAESLLCCNICWVWAAQEKGCRSVYNYTKIQSPWNFLQYQAEEMSGAEGLCLLEITPFEPWPEGFLAYFNRSECHDGIWSTFFSCDACCKRKKQQNKTKCCQCTYYVLSLTLEFMVKYLDTTRTPASM